MKRFPITNVKDGQKSTVVKENTSGTNSGTKHIGGTFSRVFPHEFPHRFKNLSDLIKILTSTIE